MATDTSKLTIRLPTEDIAFAKRYAKANGLSVTEVIGRYLRRMRLLDREAPRANHWPASPWYRRRCRYQGTSAGQARAVILVDLNVVPDVVQKREPDYSASAAVLALVTESRIRACLPAHAFTTLHYLVSRHQTAAMADRVVDWLLRYFDVAGTTRHELEAARQLDWPDAEDAVVAAAAKSSGCTQIVTRNIRDFGASPAPALTPEQYLLDTH